MLAPGEAWRKPVTHRPPARMRAWLEEPGSITAHMRAACPGGFTLALLGQRRGRPFAFEARRLSLAARRFALIREVLLCCRDVPWVFARSVLPVALLTGRRRRMALLGARPLGDLLFSHPGVERGQVRVTPAGAAPELAGRCADMVAADLEGAWLRQSLFLFDNGPLLVNEIFLSTINHG